MVCICSWPIVQGQLLQVFFQLSTPSLSRGKNNSYNFCEIHKYHTKENKFPWGYIQGCYSNIINCCSLPSTQLHLYCGMTSWVCLSDVLVITVMLYGSCYYVYSFYDCRCVCCFTVCVHNKPESNFLTGQLKYP